MRIYYVIWEALGFRAILPVWRREGLILSDIFFDQTYAEKLVSCLLIGQRADNGG